MGGRDEHEAGTKAADTRPSGLAAALLRTGASLDLETVLNEVVESARALSGARYGAITTIDETNAPQDFVTSGFTEEEHRNMAEWSDGPRLFEFFRDLEGPLRIPDLRAYARSLGFSTDLMPEKSLLGTPMRHRGVHVGNFYLAEKEGGAAFTDADEEVLLLFAAQAAAAIAHARAYRDERRARADLEALVETSPVGVAVFDAGSGAVLSFNPEAQRIVESLRNPGQAPEDLLQVMVCRLADGREIVLGELPMAAVLSNAETMRAEEIELSVADGRSVRVLVNATPIRAEDGTVASVVVTMQDLAPLEELERMRAAFLGMVSHELRAPLAAIKGSATTVLGRSRVYAAAEMEQFFRIIEEQADRMEGLIGDLLDAGRIEAGTLTVAPERCTVADLADRARATFQSGGACHRIVVDLPPDLPRVMADRERVVQVLNNLLGNAARHAPVLSPIRVEAAQEGTHVAIAVADEGRGIAPERLVQLFRKYAPEDDGGRGIGGGLGLAICKGLVEAHGGAHPRRERRARARRAIYLHASGGGRGVRRTGRVRTEPGVGVPRRRRTAAHPRRRRRPGDAAPGPRRARGRGLRPARDGRPGGAREPPRGREARAGAARPDAAGDRRDRAHAAGAGTCGRAGALHLRLRPRRDGGAGARGRRRGLHRQALLGDGARGAGAGGAATAGGSRTVRAGRPRHRLRPPAGDAGGGPRRAHRHRV